MAWSHTLKGTYRRDAGRPKVVAGFFAKQGGGVVGRNWEWTVMRVGSMPLLPYRVRSTQAGPQKRMLRDTAEIFF